MRYSAPKKKSDKKKLRDKIGAIHYRLLKLKRGDKCEICGQPGAEGRFHIIPVSESLRLEFVDDNVLLSHWMRGCQAHYKWHHEGKDSPRCDFILKKVRELKGDDYRATLKERELFMGKADILYLKIKLIEMQNELQRWELTKEGVYE